MFKHFKSVKINELNQIILKNSVQYKYTETETIVLGKSTKKELARNYAIARKNGSVIKTRKTSFETFVGSYGYMAIILKFTEDGYPIGPGLNVFKLSMLNMKIQSFVKAVYQQINMKFFQENYAKQQICEILEFSPNFEIFNRKKISCKNILYAWGTWDTIFLPVPGIETRHDGKKEAVYKPNSL